MAQDMSRCTALNLSDEALCTETATSINGLFCSLHSRQCQGMYRGYKSRSKHLDLLDQSPPSYLVKSGVALANQTFGDIESEEILKEVYDHLVTKHALIERVIRARKVHHRHFFSLSLDYGHQHYLDSLSGQKFIILRALERLEHRIAGISYKKQKWFDWVRDCQETEEAQRESEKKKTKLEAALFKRHQKEIKLRTQKLKAIEDSNRQEAELDKAYFEGLSERAKEEVEESWDPIEELVEVERGTYVDLIKHFLLISQPSSDASSSEVSDTNNELKAQPNLVPQFPDATSSTVSKPKSVKKKQATGQVPQHVPDKTLHETAPEIRRRLQEGVKVEYSAGPHIAGTIDSPVELIDNTAPLPDDEIDRILGELAEIKLLLFCRLLLSHATILPAALRASSVEELLQDKDVGDNDLRDLCLKMENPELQMIRDACADLGRGAEEDEENDMETSRQDDRNGKDKSSPAPRGLENSPMFRKNIPDKWVPKREKRIRAQEHLSQAALDAIASESGKTMIDFGTIDDEGKFQSRKMRVTICGKSIYNYRSEKAVNRGGWPHFSILAKNSTLDQAIELCRNWDEFWELNILSIFQYFPTAKWLLWKGNHRRQQLLQLGLIPYFQSTYADEASSRQQTGSRGHQTRRFHAITECRNIICCHIKRNDPASRRFCQYLSMQTSRVLVLIRDAKTGNILTKPAEGPENHNWLLRRKSGLGRASKNEWEVISEVGPKFFEAIDKGREWHFAFDDYYDIYVWDLEPGQHFSRLYATILDTFIKASRCCNLKDIYRLAAPILKSLAREPATFRTRDAKDGEETIWNTIMRGKSQFIDIEQQEVSEDQQEDIFYSEPDVLEDLVLFPTEHSAGEAVFKPSKSAVDKLVGSVPNMMRFVCDLDSDEEDDGFDDDQEDHLIEEEYREHQGCDPAIQSMARRLNRLRDFPTRPKYLSKPESEHGEDLNSEFSSEDDNSSVDLNSDFETFDLASIFQEATVEDKQDLAVMENWTCERRWGEGDPESEFMKFLDREKSKAFKQTWHEADLTPNAKEMYEEMKQITKHMEKFNIQTAPFKWCHDLRFLDVHPSTNRKVVPDIEQARAMIMLFFTPTFVNSEHGEQFKGSLLLNQIERARRGPPKTRSHMSSKYRPKNFWSEWDSKRKEKPGFSIKSKDVPHEWDIAIRPIIAKLYQAGVISCAHLAYVPGQAIAGAEPDRDPDLYIDFRVTEETINFPQELVKSLPNVKQILDTARAYAETHSSARFALLRLWSAPHFYPLMIGLQKRELTSFFDILGRAWQWLFIPKDMPGSELSIHHHSRSRIEPYQKIIGKNVFVCRDKLLVMGEDEADLAKFAVATTFALQTNPWRTEVDLWKSFVNVELDFLEGLAEEWLI